MSINFINFCFGGGSVGVFIFLLVFRPILTEKIRWRTFDRGGSNFFKRFLQKVSSEGRKLDQISGGIRTKICVLQKLVLLFIWCGGF